MKKNFLKILSAHLLVFGLLLVPVVTSAANIDANMDIVPCGHGTNDQCGFGDLLTLVNNFIGYFIKFVFAPLVSLTLVYIGFLFIRDKADAKTEAKKLLMRVVIGSFIVLAAWLIVNYVVNQFVSPDIVNPLK